MGTNRTRDEDGAVAILMALLAALLLVTAALVVDLGLVRDTRRHTQVAADAAALAGANVLYPESGTCTAANPDLTVKSPCLTDAVNEAKQYAELNYELSSSEWSNANNDCQVPSGFTALAGTNCVSFDDLNDPTKVRVDIPMQQVDFGLGVVTGEDHAQIRSGARAIVQAGGAGECGLCFLTGVDTQNSDFTVEGASIHVNGDLDVSSGNSEWTAENIYVVGTPSPKATYDPAPTPANQIEDPLKDDPRFPPATTGLSNKSDPCKNGPGIYGAFQIPNKGTCTLSKGLYVVTGTWSMKNKSVLNAPGVTIYVTASGMLDFKNGEVDTLRAPTAAEATASASKDIADFAIVYDRSNTKTMSLQGNGETSIIGGVYLAQAKLDFNGNSNFGFSGSGCASACPIVAYGIVGKGGGNKSTVYVKDAHGLTVKNLPGDIALDQ